MDCTVDCNQDIDYCEKLGPKARFKKWLQTLVLEGAEYMSKTK